MDWMDRAECRKYSPDVMDDSSLTIVQAKLICAACPVVDACLALAMERNEPWGVWGGLSSMERNRHARGGSLLTCPRHRIRSVGRKCYVCSPIARTVDLRPPTPFKKLVEQEDRIREMVAMGMSDRECAIILSEELGARVAASSVQKARRRWGITRSDWRNTRLDMAIVQAAWEQLTPLRELSWLERKELYHQWKMSDRSDIQFRRIYRCSWSALDGLKRGGRHDQASRLVSA